MVDLFVADLFEVGGGFFASNAAGTEHGNGLGFIRKVSFGPVGEFPEVGGVGIDSVLESAVADFVAVADVDNLDVWVGDKLVPVFRLDVFSHLLVRVGEGLAHGDDLSFAANAKAGEGVGACGGVFAFEVGESRVMVEELEEGGEVLGGSGDGGVDAFFGEEDGALNFEVEAGLFDPGLEVFDVVKPDEPVKGGDLDFGGVDVEKVPANRDPDGSLGVWIGVEDFYEAVDRIVRSGFVDVRRSGCIRAKGGAFGWIPRCSGEDSGKAEGARQSRFARKV